MTSKQDLLGSPIERFTRRMFTEIITSLAKSLRDDDLTVAQVALLHQLDHAPLSSKTAAELLDLQPPAMSRLVDDLVERKLVTRREAEHDRRVRLLALSPTGKTFVDRASEARVARVLEITSARVPGRLRDAVLRAMNAFREGGV